MACANVRRVKLRLSDPSLIPEFLTFLGVQEVSVTRLDNDDVEVLSNENADDETHEMLVDLMLRAWNAAHGEAQVQIVDDAG